MDPLATSHVRARIMPSPVRGKASDGRLSHPNLLREGVGITALRPFSSAKRDSPESAQLPPARILLRLRMPRTEEFSLFLAWHVACLDSPGETSYCAISMG